MKVATEGGTISRGRVPGTYMQRYFTRYLKSLFHCEPLSFPEGAGWRRGGWCGLSRYVVAAPPGGGHTVYLDTSTGYLWYY